MFKAMILLKRKEEYSQREFRNWWLGEHAQLAIQLPGLKKLCFNPAEDEAALYDGVAELWLCSYLSCFYLSCLFASCFVFLKF